MSDRREAASGALADVERLRTQVRSDRRETSIPLLALGMLTVLSAWVTPFVGGILLAFVAVVVLLVLAGYYRRREQAVGLRTQAGRWTTAGMSVLVVYVLVPWLAMLFLPPVAIVGIVVAVLGYRSRNRPLVLGGVAAAVVSGAEQWFIISNRFWDLAKLVDAGPHTWWVSNTHQLVLATLAASLLAGGAVALHRERRRG
jgi:hypothetical protein